MEKVLTINQVTILNYMDIVPLFDHYRIFYKKDSSIKEAKTFLLDRITNNQSIIFAVYLYANIVGFAQIYYSFSYVNLLHNWILNDLYVVEEARQKGCCPILVNYNN